MLNSNHRLEQFLNIRYFLAHGLAFVKYFVSRKGAKVLKSVNQERTPGGGGANRNLEKNRSCRRGDIKRFMRFFMRFTFQPKSATEIG
jgi:hypothetical protein